jgi:hypothetical protein
MSKSKKKSAKKEFRLKIAELLTTTFSDLKDRISNKKFERRIQRASKVLAQGINPAKETKPVKKATPKS